MWPLHFMPKGIVHDPNASHLCESVFRTYETWLLRLVACYPEPLVITPDFSVATFKTQVRNAANAFLQHRYESELSYDDFAVAWRGTIVRATADKIVIAPRTTPVAEAVGQETSVAPQKFLMELTSPSLTQLAAVANLYVTGTTMQPTKIIGEVPAGATTVLEPFGVKLYPQEDGSHLLL